MNNDLNYNRRFAFRKSIAIGSSEWGKKVGHDIDKDYFCKCGHVQVFHKLKHWYCGGLEDYYTGVEELLCKCNRYQCRNNLAYLEQIYDKKHR